MHSKISLETIESIKILWPHFKRKVGLKCQQKSASVSQQRRIFTASLILPVA